LNSEGLPVILMGDFNETVNDYSRTVPARLAEAGFITADLAAPATSNLTSTTFHDFNIKTTSTAHIDYIMASPLTTYVSYSVLKSTAANLQPSDHYPITAKLDIY
jgi:endonuclease/exonuclease/phosphatase family metal-dependent hydrolase